MNKLITKIVGTCLGLTMAVGVGVAVGSNKNAVEAEAAAGDKILAYSASGFGTSYGVKTGTSKGTDGTTDYSWVVTSGGNTSSLGSNSKNFSSATVLGSTYAKYGTPISVTSSTTGVSVFALTTSMNNVGKISYSGSQGKGTTQKVYVLYSSNNSTFSQLTLTSGTQGASFSSGTNFQFATCSGYFALVFQTTATSGDWRIDSFKADFFEGSTTTSYTVGGTITNGALSSTASVDSGSALNITLNPNEHYHLPTSLTSVTMGGNALVSGTGYTYNNSTGAISIASVTGNVVINATCPEDSKYTVTYSASTNGSGSHAVANQYEGDYTLLDYASISGTGKVNADDGYRFKDYTVGGQTKAPGDTISLSANTTVTVNFEERPNQAKYSITAVNTAGLDSTYDNAVPTGAGFNFSATYTNNAYQMTAEHSQTWTFTGYTGKIIKSLKVSIKNNASSGVGAAAMTNNGSSVTLKQSSFTGLGGSYAEYELINSNFEVAGNVVLTLSCSTNSFFCEYVILEWEDGNILDEDLTINDTNATKSFTVGDTFAFGGSATASYSQTGDEDVTSDVTFTLGNTDIAIGDTITAAMLDNETITSEVIEVAVWYEDANGHTAAGAYNVTVSYAAVTSVNISTSTTEIAKSSEFTFGATVLPSNANSKVTWSATSEDLTENSDFSINSSTGKLEVDTSIGGIIRVTATTIGKDSSSASKTAYVDVTVTGDPVVTFNHSELSGFSGKTGSLTATPANFSGTVTYSWSSNNACVTVPNNNVATNTLTYVSAGTATITVTATYGQNESAFATCDVTVTATSVTSVQWTNASNLTVYSGSTALNAAKITSWAPTFSVNNGDPDAAVPTANYDVYLNGNSYTLGTALVAGTYTVTLSYGGRTTVSSNPVVTVIQRLNTINVTSEDSVSWSDDGSTNVFNGASGTTTLGGVTWSFTRTNTATNHAGTTGNRYFQFGTKAAGGEDVEIRTSNIPGTIKSISVLCATGSETHTISISVGGNSYISQTAPAWNNNTNAGDTVTGTGTSSGEIVISFVGGAATAATAGKALYIRTISVTYVQTVNVSNAEGHEATQAKVVEFAQYMNEQMNGTKVCTGDMSNLGTAWTNVSTKYTTLFGAGSSLSETELAYAKDMIANASANWNESHDSDEQYCLEKAMKTYEWCVSHYSGTCTAFMSAIRPVGSAHVTPLTNIVNGANNATIIAVISLIGITAIGGYFFLHKKKEENY